MPAIDWGECRPTPPWTDALEARLARIDLGAGPPVRIRRLGNGFEAQLAIALPERVACVRLHGDHATDAVERLADLLEALTRARVR